MFDTPRHRRIAAVVALIYVAVQSFQWYVFGHLPGAGDPVQQLLQGPHPLNLARATSMLLSFFGLAYLFLVACGIAWRRNPALAVLAFLGFFVFCLLEVQLRAVELFHVYLALPEQYRATTDTAEHARILAAQGSFQSVQYALYFPLGLSWLLGSVLACLALGRDRMHWLALWAFGLNAVRLFLRMIDSYLIGPKFDALYGTLYLPLVYLSFVPLAIWLWRQKS
ncbi:hypothetical protein ACTJI2_01230 [Pseudoxanthomonas sp. 22568]|uniref:hypothetical protein n=1 Tax=Pseudoxanthomonas sp. 22568 TaxID=3453945 RepID=UPI003F84D30B